MRKRSFISVFFKLHDCTYNDILITGWPEWESNPRPRAYRAHRLTTELCDRTM